MSNYEEAQEESLGGTRGAESASGDMGEGQRKRPGGERGGFQAQRQRHIRGRKDRSSGSMCSARPACGRQGHRRQD